MLGDTRTCSLASQSAKSGPSVETPQSLCLSFWRHLKGLGDPDQVTHTAQGTSSVAVGALASIPGCREEKVPLNFQDLCSRSHQTIVDTILNRTDL